MMVQNGLADYEKNGYKEREDFKKEEKDLMFEVKNRAKYEKLLNDPHLQSALKKLSDKMISKAFGKEWEILNDVNVSKKLKIFEEKNPGLNLYIKSLGLENVGSFKNLTNEQKFKFVTLNEAIKTGKTVEDIIKNVKKIEKEYMKRLGSSFSWNHITNFLQLKKTLEDYGLNSKEIQKVQELVDLIDKWKTLKNMIYEKISKYIGGSNSKLMMSNIVIATFWAFVAGMLTSGFIAFLITRDDDEDEDKPRKKIDSFTRTGSMKEVSERVTYKDKQFSYEHGELKMCDINEGGNIVKRTRNMVKSGVNYFQNREIDMMVMGTVEIKFPLEDEGEIKEIYDAETGTFTVNLIFPEEPILDVVNLSTKVLHEGHEAVRMDDWKNLQSQLIEQGKASIKAQAIADGIVEKGRKALIRKVEDHYKGILDLVINDKTGYTLEVNVSFLGENLTNSSDSLNVPLDGHKYSPIE